MPASATSGVNGDRNAHRPEGAVGARDLRAPDRGGGVGQDQVRSPYRGRGGEDPEALVLLGKIVHGRLHATRGKPAITATVTTAVSDREVPVERDVVDVDVVARGHASREPARDAVELHDDAQRDVGRRPRHQHPDGRGIGMAGRIEARERHDEGGAARRPPGPRPRAARHGSAARWSRLFQPRASAVSPHAAVSRSGRDHEPPRTGLRHGRGREGPREPSRRRSSRTRGT